jgi:hypothetical protein
MNRSILVGCIACVTVNDSGLVPLSIAGLFLLAGRFCGHPYLAILI